MDMVNIKINGMACEVPAGSTILEAAREAGIDIPTLCFLKDINQIGACRMCMVEVKGARSLVAACVYPVNLPALHYRTRPAELWLWPAGSLQAPQILQLLKWQRLCCCLLSGTGLHL